MKVPTSQGSKKDPTTSLHQRILNEIEQNILTGKWVPGYRIPSENELAITYQCSRMTVNKVLTQLARANMVERKRKAGTVVLRSQSRSAVLVIQDIRAEVAALDLPYRYDILARKKRRSTRTDMKQLDLVDAGAVLEMQVLHYAGVRPFCLESRLINLDTVPRAGVEDFSDQSPGAWLRGHVPWTSAEHRIRVGTVGPDLTEILKVDVGTPGLIIERSTWLQGKSVTFVRLLYPGDSHELVARFSPTIHTNGSDDTASAA
jgi:GntR family histidine utilization transcriptional repressor